MWVLTAFLLRLRLLTVFLRHCLLNYFISLLVQEFPIVSLFFLLLESFLDFRKLSDEVNSKGLNERVKERVSVPGTSNGNFKQQISKH